MNQQFRNFLLAIILFTPASIFGQTTAPVDSIRYPKMVWYTCLFLPIVSASNKATTWNFSNTFSLGFATGINILYSDKLGFSFDLSPVITSSNGTSKVGNFIFDPGPIFRFKKGYSLITRMAFETAGRYGESTVLSKVFSPGKKSSLLAALGIPLRFGNNLPASVGATLFLGVAFK